MAALKTRLRTNAESEKHACQLSTVAVATDFYFLQISDVSKEQSCLLFLCEVVPPSGLCLGLDFLFRLTEQVMFQPSY